METYENILEEKPIIVPTKEHSTLTIFVGKWAIEGENLAVKGIETYEWLPGGFFMVYKWSHYFGGERHKLITMIIWAMLEHIRL